MEFKLKETPEADVTETDTQIDESQFVNPNTNAGYLDLDALVKEQTGIDLKNPPKYKNYYEEGPVLGRYSTENIIRNTIKTSLDLSRSSNNPYSSNRSSNNPYSIHIAFGCLVIAFFILLGMSLKTGNVVYIARTEVEGIVIDSEKRATYERHRRRSRMVDYYFYTYEWEGENGEIQTHTIKSRTPKYRVGETITVTVRSDNLNVVVPTKKESQSKYRFYSFACILCFMGASFTLYTIMKKKKK